MPARFVEGGIILDPEIDAAADYYFPANYLEVQSLLGKMLTHIDALGLPPEQGKASKDLVRQSISQWWSDVQENSLTSVKGCIGPIEVQRSARRSVYRWVALAQISSDTKQAAVYP